MQQARLAEPPAVGLWRMERDCIAGRLDADTRARHDLPASLDRWGGSSLVLREDFEHFSLARGGGWRRVGLPDARVLAEPNGNHYLVLAGVPEEGSTGVARDLPASLLAGRLVLCEVKTRVSNPAAVRRLGMPTLELVTESADGTGAHTAWPLMDEASPGWEQQRFVWSAPSDLQRVTLRLVQDGAVAAAWFDDLVLRLVSPGAVPGLRVPARVGDNILPGGDFETDVKAFTVRHEDSPSPAPWFFDADAAVGAKSLYVPLENHPVLVSFGPIAFARTGKYVLALQAKGSPGVRVSAEIGGVAGAGRLPVQPLTPQWQRYETSLDLPSAAFEHIGFLQVRLDADGDSARPRGAWIDAVALTRGAPAEQYTAPNECEIGIVDARQDPVDLAQVLNVDQSPGLTVHCVNYAERPRSCTLAVDVTDGFDRVVSSQTVRTQLPTRGSRDHALSLTLPRGYYRVLATLWPGSVGQGEPLSQAERSIALVDLLDPVPHAAPCGLRVVGDFCSERLTQLGFGWVRWQPGPQPDGHARESFEKQALEVLLVPPATGIGGLVAALGPSPIGVEVHETNPTTQTTSAESGSGDVPRSALPPVPADAILVDRTTDVAALMDRLRASNRAVATVSFPEGPLPEAIDPAVTRLQKATLAPGGPQLWDLGVPLRVVSNYVIGQPIRLLAPAPGEMAPLDADPALEASRAVRGYVLRMWAGLARVCYRPEIFPPDTHPVEAALLSETDLSPTPLVPAVDYMNRLLNTAVPVAWFDLAGEVRVLCFKSGATEHGSTVGVMWRPFGCHPTWIRLAGMAGVVDVRNVFGSRETFQVADGDLIVPASEFVLYLICPEKSETPFLSALGTPTDDSPSGGSPDG